MVGTRRLVTQRRQVRLTTSGRRTGEPRSVTLYAWPDGRDLIVVGSAGGRARHPAWALNLRATPDAEIQEGKQRWAVRAREPEGEERDRLWQLVTEAFPLYATYQRRTDRTLPIFVLEPAVD
ncbi:MAG TPA: nitroreductase/quinone reductase family protein [Candidatus Limnocylindria bacterium]